MSGTLFDFRIPLSGAIYTVFMGRVLRVDVGNTIYHVINRANFRSRLFKNDEQYRDFINILREAKTFVPVRILAYCLMPNHWHLVLYPENDGDLSQFMQRITLTHTQRYHAKTSTIGYGHIYQGRYKSLPVQDDQYLLNLVRYVERNARRAAMVEKAEDWRWSSAHARMRGTIEAKNLLSNWPMPVPEEYLDWLNQSQPKEEIENIRYAVNRSKPYGSPQWVAKTVQQFGLEITTRDPWRPNKGT